MHTIKTILKTVAYTFLTLLVLLGLAAAVNIALGVVLIAQR